MLCECQSGTAVGACGRYRDAAARLELPLTSIELVGFNCRAASIRVRLACGQPGTLSTVSVVQIQLSNTSTVGISTTARGVCPDGPSKWGVDVDARWRDCISAHTLERMCVHESAHVRGMAKTRPWRAVVSETV